MFKDRKFSDEEPILIFKFVIRLEEEVETLEIRETQLMVLLPDLLSCNSSDQYRVAASR